MAPRHRPRPDLETNTGPDAPVGDIPLATEAPVVPSDDGGNPQHPIHDEDQEDRMPDDYEHEIDRLDATINNRIP